MPPFWDSFAVFGSILRLCGCLATRGGVRTGRESARGRGGDASGPRGRAASKDRLPACVARRTPATCAPGGLDMAAFANACLPACLLVLTLVRLSRPDSGRSPWGAPSGPLRLPPRPRPGAGWGGPPSVRAGPQPPPPRPVSAAPLDVVGPAEPVVAALGGDAELPCSLSASASAERMELRWYRGRRAAAVLVRRDGRARDAEQAAEFRGRATLLDGGLAAGRAAVRLHRVRASDDGEYRCLFRQDGRYGEASVHLKVAGECAGPPPGTSGAVCPPAAPVLSGPPRSWPDRIPSRAERLAGRGWGWGRREGRRRFPHVAGRGATRHSLPGAPPAYTRSGPGTAHVRGVSLEAAARVGA